MVKNAALPLYLQIAEDIKKNIENEVYSGDGRLPLESWFIDHYDASRVTIRKAFDELIKEGVVERIPYKGIFLTNRRTKVSLRNSFYAQDSLAEKEANCTFKIQSFEVIQATPKLSQIFHIEEKEPLYFLQVLRFKENIPYMLQYVYLNKALMPNLDIFLLKDNLLHEIIENNYGLEIDYVDFKMSVAVPTEEQLALLNTPSVHALLQASDTLYLKDGQIARYGISLYTDKVDYTYTLYP